MARRFERARDDFFRMAEAVDGCGVDPVDAKVERAMDRGDGFVVVLGAPGEFPVAAADGPCAKADGCEVKVRVAESHPTNVDLFVGILGLRSRSRCCRHNTD